MVDLTLSLFARFHVNGRSDFGRTTSISSNDAYERRLAEVLAFMRDLKAKRMQEGQG